MKLVFCLVIFLTLNQSIQANPSPKALTLEEFKSLVQTSSHRLRAMKLRKNAAKIAIDIEEQKKWPRLKAKGGYQHEENSKAREDFLTGSLEVSYDIIDLPTKYKAKKAQAELTLQKDRLAQKQYKIINETEVNFYRLLFLDKKLKALNDLINRTKSNLIAVKKRVRSGKSAKSDIISFELELTDLTTNKKTLQRERYIAKKKLLIDVHDAIKDFSPIGDLPHYHLEESHQSISSKINSSFAVKNMIAKSDNAKLLISSAKAKKYPKLGVAIEGGYFDPDFSLTKDRAQVEGRLYLTWDLFPGLLNTSEGKKSSKLALASLVEKEHSIHLLQDEIESVVNELKSIQDRVDTDLKKIKLSKRLYKAVLQEYRRGIKSNEDVKSASKAIYNSQVSDYEGRLSFVELVKGLESKLGSVIKVSKHK